MDVGEEDFRCMIAMLREKSSDLNLPPIPPADDERIGLDRTQSKRQHDDNFWKNINSVPDSSQPKLLKCLVRDAKVRTHPPQLSIEHSRLMPGMDPVHGCSSDTETNMDQEASSTTCSSQRKTHQHAWRHLQTDQAQVDAPLFLPFPPSHSEFPIDSIYQTQRSSMRYIERQSSNNVESVHKSRSFRESTTHMCKERNRESKSKTQSTETLNPTIAHNPLCAPIPPRQSANHLPPTLPLTLIFHPHHLPLF